MTLTEWLEAKTNANRIEACEVVLARFRAAADASPEFTAAVGEILWTLLSSRPGADPEGLLSEMRSRVGALGRERIDNLSTRLLQVTAAKGEIECEAGKLVSSWSKVIALCPGPAHRNSRAFHVTRDYERTFASLGRLLEQTRSAPPVDYERAAA
jgi:hypothetical protein